MDLLDTLNQDPNIKTILGRLSTSSSIELKHEGWGGLGPMLAFIGRELRRPLLYIGSNEERVRFLFSDCSLFSENARFFPEPDGSALPDPMLHGERSSILEELANGKKLSLFSTLASILDPVRSPADLKSSVFHLKKKSNANFSEFAKTLEKWGYVRTASVSAPNEFAVRGGIVDLYPFGAPLPYRIEWIEETVDTIRVFDPGSQRTIEKRETLDLYPPENTGAANALVLDYLPENTILVTDEGHPWDSPGTVPGVSQGCPRWTVLKLSSVAEKTGIPWPFQPIENFSARFNGFLLHAKSIIAKGEKILICTRQASRLKDVLREEGLLLVEVAAIPLSQGFRIPSESLHVYTDHELFGRVVGLLSARKTPPSIPIDLERITEGDLVVHERHGIAMFDGIIPISVSGMTEDYLALSFADKDKLYVPLDEMNQVERYVGSTEKTPVISRLGSAEWRNSKRKARDDAKKIAHDLVELYATRSESPGHAYAPDTPWQTELEEAFPFVETPDQKEAILDTKRDMESGKPMDRLILGDVGYGKTEVALRAAFKAVMDGKQAAVLVPTTILAAQHYETFRERLMTFPIRLCLLSRFQTKKEHQQTLDGLAGGEVDIVIGTHRLIQKDVMFKNLGLIIIDEEQRFGVKHKEALKALRHDVDVLTLSATPIPRTLYFSLAGVRDISVIETPPLDRLPVKTIVASKDDQIVEQAIRDEMKREGQIFYLYNHIAELESKAKTLERLVPGVRLAIAHGGMKPAHLEEIMWAFLKGFTDLLLATTIIENGLDIPRVNTLIVEEAERYGLADLYQLRGRVGRSNRQAYAYFLTSPRGRWSGLAEKRLQTIEEFAHLGSGYQIAMRDLELRGAGNLLGTHQHGHVSRIGFHLYCQILAEEVKKLKGEKLLPSTRKVSLEIPIPAYFPDTYIESRSHKLNLYRRLSDVKTTNEVENIREELRDRFGPIPEEAQNLLEIVTLKLSALEKNIEEIQMTPTNVRISFRDGREALFLPAEPGLPIKIRLELLKAKLAIIEKGFR